MKAINTMPESNSTPPRLTCRVLRLGRIVFANWNSRHVAACPECQAYYRAGSALENALRLEARQMAETGNVARDYERRLLQAIRDSRRSAEPARRASWNPGWATGGLASAAALAVAAFFLGRDTAPPARDDLPGPLAAADAELIVETVESLSNQFVDTVIPSAGKAVAVNPLQQEIGLVYSDMRSALDFLALNFLPSVPSAPSSPPTRTI
jgi:hypothetical protein